MNAVYFGSLYVKYVELCESTQFFVVQVFM